MALQLSRKQVVCMRALFAERPGRLGVRMAGFVWQRNADLFLRKTSLGEEPGSFPTRYAEAHRATLMS